MYKRIAYMKFYDDHDMCIGNGIPVGISVEYSSLGDTKLSFECIHHNFASPSSELVNRVREGLTLAENWRRKHIKKVIFHDPATIVFWMDGSKTVVKCQEGETYDPEKGLAMAISKKVAGNNGSYYNEFKKWLGEAEDSKDNSKKGAK